MKVEVLIYPIYEDGDANKFFNKHPEGFKFNYYKICDLQS